MFVCRDCGAIFEYPKVTRDDPSPPGVALPSGYYTYHECPECGGDFDEAETCASCGEYFDGRTGALCADCRDYLARQLLNIRDTLDITDDDLQDAICALYEW